VDAHASAQVRRISTTEKGLIMKRSHSSPGEGRQSLSAGETIPKQTDSSETRPAVARRRSKAEKAEKAEKAKRSHSSPGEGRLSLSAAEGGDNNGQGALVAGPTVGELQDTHEDSVLTSHNDDCSPSLAAPVAKEEKSVRDATWGPFIRDARHEWARFVTEHADHWSKLVTQRNRCLGALLVMCIYCGLGGMLFRFTEGAFEAFYKCGVKRVKRDFVDSLWLGSQHLLEDEW
jgi:hypothetical protein